MRHFQRTGCAIRFLAIAVIFCLLCPPVLAATQNSTILNSYIVDAPSEHASEYDEIVNVANSSAGQNTGTWNPTYQGIWIGGSTKESLYQFNEVTAADSVMALSWEAQFSPGQIMSGASEFCVRLPYYSDIAQVDYADLNIYHIDSSNDYTFTGNLGTNDIDLAFSTGAYRTYASSHIDPHDAAPMDGDDWWTMDNRAYIEVRAPLEPNEIYLFVCWVYYLANTNFKVYLSPNDVASDGYVNAHISRYVPTSPMTYTFSNQNYTLDLGVSYDFKQGMGGKFVSREFYMPASSYLAFYSYCSGARNKNGYHSIMIPFITSNGTGNFSVSAEPCSNLATTSIDIGPRDYYGYILACEPAPFNASTSSANGDIYNVRITATYAQLVTFIFQDIPDNDLHPSFIAHGYADHNDTEMTTVSGMGLFFKLQNVYLVTSNFIDRPVPGAITIPAVEPIVNSRQVSWGALLIGLVFGPVGGAVYLLASYAHDHPGTVKAVYTDIMGAGLSFITFGNPMIWFLYNGVLGQGGFAHWLNLPDLGSIPTILRNILDGAWNALTSVGQFLWSIGEQVYAALTWLANAIMEYGAVLLGLLIIAVALLIFFYPIHYQVKLWTAGLLMAQGKFTQADRELSGVAKDINRTGRKGLRLFTKVGRRLK